MPPGRIAITTACIPLKAWLNIKLSSRRSSANAPQRLQQRRKNIVSFPVASTLASRASIVARWIDQPSKGSDEERIDPTILTNRRQSPANAPSGVERRAIDSGPTSRKGADQASSSELNQLLLGANRAVRPLLGQLNTVPLGDP